MYAGRSEDAEEIDSCAYDYATRQGYTPPASQAAYNQAYRLCVEGRAHEALRFTDDVIRRAERIGDDAGRALLLMWHGLARVAIDDPLGINELREAAAILQEHSHQKTSVAYHNLAEILLGAGQLAEAAQARGESARWAERFGIADQIGSEKAAQAGDEYHAGEWTTAMSLCLSVIDHPAETIVVEARGVRGRVTLARGDAESAVEDASRILEQASRDGRREIVLQGLALSALAHHSRGDQEAAQQACQRFIDHWCHVGGLPNQAPALAEVAIVSQHDALTSAAMLLSDASRWKTALVAMAEGRYADAATIYGEIGSRPLEAGAYLRAAHRAADARDDALAADYAERALSFYRGVGAVAYIREAEALVAQARSA